MEATYVPASSMHFAQVSLEASTFLDGIAAEVHKHGHGDWFEGKSEDSLLL